MTIDVAAPLQPIVQKQLDEALEHHAAPAKQVSDTVLDEVLGTVGVAANRARLQIPYQSGKMQKTAAAQVLPRSGAAGGARGFAEALRRTGGCLGIPPLPDRRRPGVDGAIPL